MHPKVAAFASLFPPFIRHAKTDPLRNAKTLRNSQVFLPSPIKFTHSIPRRPLKKKEAGEKIEPAKEGPAPRVVNLMDALRASIDAGKKKAPAPSSKARRPAKKKASQR